MKKLVCILMIVCIMTGFSVGCSKTSKDSDENKTLTVGVVQNLSIDEYNDNAFTKYIEQELGIDIVFEYFSSSASEYMQQLALRASSNEKLPEVIWGFHDMDTYTMNQYGEDGYFLDLTDLIDKYGTNYKAQYEKLSEENQARIQKGRSTDGALYGMPLLSVEGIDNIQNQMYINQTWLDKLGLKAPTNINELYNVLKAFLEKDPNGNEINDEIPMLGYAKGETDITGYMINAFTYFDVTNRLHVENEKVTATFITDEYRQALIYMNKLCKEGLLSDFCFTITSAELRSMITPNDGVSKVGIWCGNPDLVSDTTNPILSEYTPLTYLADATGKGGYSVVRQPSLSFCSYITKDCKDVESAMKFLDIFYNDETVKRMRFGEKGVHWIDETGKDAFGNDVYMKVIDDSAFFEGNATWGRNGHCIMTPANYYRVAESGNSAQDTVQKLAGETWKLHTESPKPEKKVQNLVYTSEEYTEKKGYETLIADYVKEARNLFVEGTMDPSSDADWQKYVQTFDKLSLSRFLEIQQAAYDRQ